MKSSYGAYKDIRAGHSDEEREKANIGNGHNRDGDQQDEDPTAACAIGIRDSSKRTADSAGLNKRGQAVFRLEKVQRTGQSAGLSCCMPHLMIPERP